MRSSTFCRNSGEQNGTGETAETDRGVAIIMDRRVAGLKDIDAELCQDIPSKEREFFSYSKYDL